MDTRAEEYKVALALAEKRYAADPWAFLIEQARTVDEASQELEVPWPDRAVLHDLIDVLEDPDMEGRVLGILKSRRVMVSWTVAAWVWWRIRYHAANAALWQSRTEPEAAFVLDRRIGYLEEHIQDKPLQRTFKAIRTSKGLMGRIMYARTESWVQAAAQGKDVFRSYTPSILVMDECEFQPESNAALTAALPLNEKGARIVLMSSSNGPGWPLASIYKRAGFSRWT